MPLSAVDIEWEDTVDQEVERARARKWELSLDDETGATKTHSDDRFIARVCGGIDLCPKVLQAVGKMAEEEGDLLSRHEPCPKCGIDARYRVLFALTQHGLA